jgi:isoleucyl-tRNA synthetase
MAEDGRKMSKSLGNQVFPQDVIKQSGADILRLWVMNTDYWEDQRLGKTMIKTNIDAYRKLRNTIRWMLGTLAHDGGEAIDPSDMPELERLMLHRLSELDQLVRRAMTISISSASRGRCSILPISNCRRSISTSARMRSIAMRPRASVAGLRCR